MLILGQIHGELNNESHKYRPVGFEIIKIIIVLSVMMCGVPSDFN